MSMVVPERTEHKYEPYPEYEDSGVEWLGQIPSHWDIRKLKQISSTKVSGVDKHSKEDEKPVYLCNYTDVYNKDTILPDNGFMEATATDNEIALFSLKKDDVIITKDSEDWRDIAVPSYVSTNLPGVICGYHLALIRPELSNIIGRFLFWSFYARNINHQFVIASTGITRFGLGKYWLDNSLFLIPPIEEQRTIADFLDRETARIDELIAKKRRLIELLQEQRTALITHAVTKGLTPDIPVKDSGVEWLGEIPAHWEVKKLKRLGWFQSGAGFPDNDQGLQDEDLPFYKVSDMNLEGNNISMTTCNNSVSRDTAERLGATVFPKSTIIFPKVGAALLTNKRRILTCDACIDNNIMGFFIKRGNVKYFYYRLLTLDFGRLANPGAVPSMNESQACNIETNVPPISEQQAIANYLDRETVRIDSLVAKTNQAMEKLQEYRTALITAAVTGKIDVRQYVS